MIPRVSHVPHAEVFVWQVVLLMFGDWTKSRGTEKSLSARYTRTPVIDHSCECLWFLRASAGCVAFGLLLLFCPDVRIGYFPSLSRVHL